MAKLQSRVQTLTNLYLVAKPRRGILHFLSFYCPAKLYLLQPTELPAVINHSEVCWLRAQYHVPVLAPWLGVLYLPATISFPPSVSRNLWFLPTNFFHFLLLNSVSLALFLQTPISLLPYPSVHQLLPLLYSDLLSSIPNCEYGTCLIKLGDSATPTPGLWLLMFNTYLPSESG